MNKLVFLLVLFTLIGCKRHDEGNPIFGGACIDTERVQAPVAGNIFTVTDERFKGLNINVAALTGVGQELFFPQTVVIGTNTFQATYTHNHADGILTFFNVQTVMPTATTIDITFDPKLAPYACE